MTCRVCGRQVEVSDGGQPMPCVCIKTPMGDVLRYILADCVGPEAPEPESECGYCGSEHCGGMCQT